MNARGIGRACLVWVTGWVAGTLAGWASGAGAPPRPNVLLVLADDLGFSDLGCYGSEIATPHLDQLAANGLRFTQFYNTGRCWPTRSALLTGYYPQQIGMDPVYPRRFPGWVRTLPHLLKPAGYRCYHSGKWHVNGAPDPRGDGGFDHSYQIEGGQNNYFQASAVTEDGAPLADREGFYVTTGVADHAIRCLKEHAAHHAREPFFAYLAFIAPHFPLHALPEDIRRYEHRYQEGWDVVRRQRWERLRQMGIVNCGLAEREPGFTPRYFRPAVLPALGAGEVVHPVSWTDLTEEQKRFQAGKMALHAAMVDRMDRETGRVLDQIREMGAWDDTLVIFLSDNGADATILVRGGGHDPAAAPGSAASYLCLGPGWASAANSPFRRYKVWNHEAGISTSFLAHWPRGIPGRGELRREPGHVIDLVPTLAELAGVELQPAPGGPAYPGRSLVPVFASERGLERDVLFFHHEGNRALREGDCKLVSAREDGDRWELFDLSSDRCEQRDLASQQPGRVRAMAAHWEALQREYEAQAGPRPVKTSP